VIRAAEVDPFREGQVLIHRLPKLCLPLPEAIVAPLVQYLPNPVLGLTRNRVLFLVPDRGCVHGLSRPLMLQALAHLNDHPSHLRSLNLVYHPNLHMRLLRLNQHHCRPVLRQKLNVKCLQRILLHRQFSSSKFLPLFRPSKQLKMTGLTTGLLTQ
jgi:hypothetical protein